MFNRVDVFAGGPYRRDDFSGLKSPEPALQVGNVTRSVFFLFRGKDGFLRQEIYPNRQMKCVSGTLGDSSISLKIYAGHPVRSSTLFV